ncbi:FeS assembly protein SufD [Sporocytophaga myxococcoides]|uniref:FeS assembly protein SufD n=1 Tax=Sporocytophaga myxococcoides TaxID=153721 RepID=A0A098LDK4_9BACT|nr:Fe-S cluster assembly protein SufD [Sporocytophaga myxococcoides]GAL85046.1 FeS assembly protein SufD [Sporocytophaga myxococcoides]
MNLTTTEELVKTFNENSKRLSPAQSDVRKDAISAFQKQGFPGRKHEEWKYTNLAPVLGRDYLIEDTTTLNKKDIDGLLLSSMEANHLVFVNGNYNKELSSVNADEPIIISDLSQSGDINEYLTASSITLNDSITELNTALANGVVITVKKGKVVNKPIIIHFIGDGRKGNIFSNTRNIFILEENAQAIFIENYSTIGSNAHFSNNITQIVVKKDAYATYYKIQNDAKSDHVGTTQVYQPEKSNFAATTITLDGGIIRNNLNIRLSSEYSEASLVGLYMVKGNTHIDNHTLVDHAKANCYSNELYKGLLDDRSTGVFNGKIYVRQDAQKTNAFQSNKNILLSKDATMNTKPQLEIFADDVKCSHGATTGMMDEEPLFYLRSRGISEKKAKALLMHAFAADILEYIKLEPLKELLDQTILDRLS